MEKIILYTKKFELIEELSKEYDLLERNPAITIEGNFQYVTLKLSPKKEKKSVGFNR